MRFISCDSQIRCPEILRQMPAHAQYHTQVNKIPFARFYGPARGRQLPCKIPPNLVKLGPFAAARCCKFHLQPPSLRQPGRASTKMSGVTISNIEASFLRDQDWIGDVRTTPQLHVSAIGDQPFVYTNCSAHKLIYSLLACCGPPCRDTAVAIGELGPLKQQCGWSCTSRCTLASFWPPSGCMRASPLPMQPATRATILAQIVAHV